MANLQSLVFERTRDYFEIIVLQRLSKRGGEVEAVHVS